MKAMRLLQSVAAALLQVFLSIRQKPFGGIEQYSKTAQIHPTTPHKVDNFLLPTLLIHQFETTEWDGVVQLKQLKIKLVMK